MDDDDNIWTIKEKQNRPRKFLFIKLVYHNAKANLLSSFFIDLIEKPIIDTFALAIYQIVMDLYG